MIPRPIIKNYPDDTLAVLFSGRHQVVKRRGHFVLKRPDPVLFKKAMKILEQRDSSSTAKYTPLPK